jgi:hypothetical protein
MITCRLIPIGLTFIAGMSGCIPAVVTRTLSPRIDGTYQREDGTPISGARILLATEPRDSTCARPVAGVLTDSAGRFTFPATTQRESFPLLLPVDRIFCIQLCGEGNGSGLPGYRTCKLHEAPPSQVVHCVAGRVAATPDRPRFACRGRPRTL